MQEQAEELLKEISLASYYDEVAMPGLELAARDLARGVLTRAQMERIKDTVIALITELEDYKDRLDDAMSRNISERPTRRSQRSYPPSSSGTMPKHGRLRGKARRESAVFAGRTPLDELPAAMLLNFCEKKARLLKLRCRILHRVEESTGLNATAWPQSVSATSI